MIRISLPRLDGDHLPGPVRDSVDFFITPPFRPPENFYEFVEVNQGARVREEYKVQQHGGREHELEFILWYNDREMKTQMDLINCMTHMNGDPEYWEYTEGWGVNLLPFIRIRMLEGSVWTGGLDEYITIRLNEDCEEEVGVLTIDNNNQRIFVSFEMNFDIYLRSL